MRMPFSNRNDRNREQPEKTPVLMEITPPRAGERSLLSVENLLGAIIDPEPFSLELAGDADGVAVMARCHDEDALRGLIAVHYPQARIRGLEPEDDPLRIDEGEQAWTTTLRSAGPEYVPLRTFQDRDLTDPGSDPLLATLGALSGLNDGERVVTRLRMRSLGPDWAVHHQRLAHERPAPPPPPQSTQPGTPSATDGIRMAVLAVGAIAALRAYTWVRADETWKAVLMGLAIVAGLIAIGYVRARFFKPKRSYAPSLIEEKVSRIAFDADVQVTIVLPSGGRPERAGAIMKRIAAAYRHYDNPSGTRFTVGQTRPVTALDTGLEPEPPGFFGSRSVIGVREAAALWHPPAPADDTLSVERSGARVLTPTAKSIRSGAPVGRTTAGRPQLVHFSSDRPQHHLYVARTQMGKSTLMRHVIVHRMREKAAGRDHDAIVVIDPHTDLVAGLLEHVPEELIPQVRLIDLADRAGAVGINLLDARVFTDRDRTADAVVRIARGLWEQWGPRMQSILEHTVKSLHEANAHPATDPARQYTILDGLPLISDARFREKVLAQVSDPYISEWWRREFMGWRHEYRADALAPVQTRLAYYASSVRARAILGQRRSTVDLRKTILDGGILLVSTAQGAVGRDVAALLGSSILNLVDAVVREQEALPPERRRGALVVVDEMQSMPGVDYESMLSELGKFGASFILATQSLAKLDDLSHTMRDTVLANVGCLAVFQVAGSDARQLVYELGRDRVSEEDIVSLPVHECYVRATVGNERTSTYSMEVLGPEPGDSAIAERIRAGTAAYATPMEAIAAEEAKRRRPRSKPKQDASQDASAQKEGAATDDAPGKTSPRNPAPEQEPEEDTGERDEAAS
ncbi:MAG: type IV secretion system DNA-binding domain-containing protein [Chloroflexi bacterium]|nr:type IV secretion system DNA-binding domain-containing protein [Chloroflexota bacterium]MYK35205.1 type IV secretion system DNA-binding domain-containing protein [Chloroflexota bacterium]